MSQRSRVEIAELRERELVGCERETGVRVRQLRAQAIATGEDDRTMVERKLRQPLGRMPGRVVREVRIHIAWHKSEVRGGELPLTGNAARIAQRLQLLEMCKLA